jgi:lipoprotein NlpD
MVIKGCAQAACLGLILVGLVACTAPGPAPVNDRTATRTAPQAEASRPVTPQIAPSTNGLHTVQRGDTLYAIAFANGLDYRDIAIWNHLESADHILVGQVLRLTPPPGAVEIMPLGDENAPRARPLAEPLVLREPQAVLLAYSDANWAQVSNARPVASAAPAGTQTVLASATPAAPAPPSPAPASTPPVTATAAAASGPVENWQWPAEGTLAGRFGEAGGKGIDIVGPRNTPVIAVAPGKVVYSGSGLRGYGQLLIIKHSGEFLSAYAHNATILVKEGDMVTAGERIALMGDSDANRVGLHFEIRRYGKPLDPLNYLPERS